jgi:DNA replication protein DnaC
MREQAPEVLQTAMMQRWSAEEVLRSLVQAEIAARDVANRRMRLKQAGFPVLKTLEAFKVADSSIPRPTFEYLASLEWVGAKENLLLIGPAGTGKSHTLMGCGVRAVERGLRVRYLVAADLIETLYRGLADNTVGKVISNLLRNELLLIDELGFAPLDDTGSQLLFRFVAAAYERRSLGVASHWPFEDWGHFLPVQTTAVSLLDRLLHHAVVMVIDAIRNLVNQDCAQIDDASSYRGIRCTDVRLWSLAADRRRTRKSSALSSSPTSPHSATASQSAG